MPRSTANPITDKRKSIFFLHLSLESAWVRRGGGLGFARAACPVMRNSAGGADILLLRLLNAPAGFQLKKLVKGKADPRRGGPDGVGTPPTCHRAATGKRCGGSKEGGSRLSKEARPWPQELVWLQWQGGSPSPNCACATDSLRGPRCRCHHHFSSLLLHLYPLLPSLQGAQGSIHNSPLPHLVLTTFL